MNRQHQPAGTPVYSWLIVGPDGSGKTGVADQLEVLIRRSGARVERLHCRPRLLRRTGISTPIVQPHATRPYSPPLAVLKLIIVLGIWWLHSLRRRLPDRRCTVTLMERGWFDMAVDPVRYGLPPSLRPLAAWMGRWVPKADVVLVLRGSPEAIDARKPEIGVPEVARQIAEWERLAPRTAGLVLPADVVAWDSASIASAAWQAAFPGGRSRRDLRWRRVPLTPGRVKARAAGDPWYAASFYRSYHPAARAVAPVRRALLMATPGRQADAPVPIEEIGHLLGLRIDGALAISSSTPGRVLLLCGQGRSGLTSVKIGAVEDPRLEDEARILTALKGQPGCYSVPRLRWLGQWRGRLVVATDAVSSLDKPIYDLDVAERICTALVTGSADSPPIVHGDFAPWNVVGAPDGPVLIDWEYARLGYLPLFDLARFVTSCGALLGQYDGATARTLLCGPGGPGWRHLEHVGVDPNDALLLLWRYSEADVWLGGHRERRFYAQLLGDHRVGHVG